MGVIRSARHQLTLVAATVLVSCGWSLAGANVPDPSFGRVLLLTPLAGLAAGTPPCWGRDKKCRDLGSP